MLALVNIIDKDGFYVIIAFMKIAFVSVESGLHTIGFRKMASLTRKYYGNADVLYISPNNFYSSLHLLKVYIKNEVIPNMIDEGNLEIIASSLSKYDMLAFSSMTSFSDLTKTIISKVKKLRKDVFILWGGIHPIIHPNDAINFADAICVGEGETAFINFISRFENGKSYDDTKNFWFNIKGKIIKNDFLPLHTPEELGSFPFPLYANDEKIFENKIGFVPCELEHYLQYNNLSYYMIWSIGCPHKCIYCSNSKFIKNDANYRKIRYPSVDYIIEEVKNVLSKHPHISTICFSDDGFIGIPYNILQEFAIKWREKVNVPFVVYGLQPANIRKDKVELLVWAGMIRVRMGIQSGSDRILKFYKRTTSCDQIRRATNIISGYSRYMEPPSYDIILDNPIENQQDVQDTIRLIYDLPRPFILNIFSLAVIPNTELAFEFERLGISAKSIKDSYTKILPSFANVLVHLSTIARIPSKLLNYLLKFAKPYSESQVYFPNLLFIVRFFFYFKRLIEYVVHFDYSVLGGKFGYFLWKTGIINKYKEMRDRRISKELVFPLNKPL
ncbi:MAG: radical SAM protein [Nitrospirae bacterium]|nr:radical SAM protein [Nitrospirota bacterium]